MKSKKTIPLKQPVESGMREVFTMTITKNGKVIRRSNGRPWHFWVKN